ncbi:hypothetical protein KFE96_07265 [Kordiimonas sp. SCSIO 12603]|uniref:S41 family peptidase n=1 Tax=Kordiimonas sp. SCSIO 12603 TaxID=2829596 RepID=UPI002108312B|nr:S41 family peptidase [Kordiimonas sp. SCSIO 12603]UTW60101.1 hypothetical protein KFE96_07265 [Kordiimonas sp. SCSIO 12603]
MIKQISTAAILAAAAFQPVFAEENVGATLTVEERIYGASNFWKEVTYNFAHWQAVPDLDWDKAYQEALPRIINAKSDFEYFMELKKLCAQLKDGHTNIYFPDGMVDANRDRFPLQLRSINSRAIVENIAREYAEQIPRGSEVLAVDGKPVKQMMEEDIYPYISTSAPHMYPIIAIGSYHRLGVGVLTGPNDSVGTLLIETPTGEQKTIELPRNRNDGDVDWAVSNETPETVEFKWLDDGKAYIALNSFSREEVVTGFKENLPELYKADSIVVDLRRNGGGSGSYAAEILKSFTDKPFYPSAWKTPIHKGAHKAWGKYADMAESLEKYREYYEGHPMEVREPEPFIPEAGDKLKVPTVFLIGPSTASAAEDILIMADDIGHITMMGEPTYGSTGQPLMMDLPGGGRARVSAKRDYYRDGKEFIGVGVLPDIEVKRTVEGVRNGTDEVLAEAIQFLGTRK